MVNELCCILPITRKDYEHMVSRFGPYGVTANTPKQLQLGFYKPAQQKKTSDPARIMPVKQQIRKNIGAMLRVYDGGYTTFMIGAQGAQLGNEKFFNECTFLRTDQNFQALIRNWSAFSDVKQAQVKKVQLESYQWQGAYQFLFYHNQAKKEEILLIMRDLNRSLQFEEAKYSREYLKLKMTHHFRELYILFCHGYHESQPFTPSQMQLENPQPRQQSKSINEFDERVSVFCARLDRFVAQKYDRAQVENWMPSLAIMVEYIVRDTQTEDSSQQLK